MNPDETPTPEVNESSPTLMYSTDESIEGIAIRALVEIARWSKEDNQIVLGEVSARIEAANSILGWVQYRENKADLINATNNLATISENLGRLTER